MAILPEQATDKVAQPLFTPSPCEGLAVRFSQPTRARASIDGKNRTAKSGCATETHPESDFSAACEAVLPTEIF